MDTATIHSSSTTIKIVIAQRITADLLAVPLCPTLKAQANKTNFNESGGIEDDSKEETQDMACHHDSQLIGGSAYNRMYE